MALIERLRGDEGFVRIPTHTFYAAMIQMARGNISRQDIIDGFNLEGADITQFDSVRDGYINLSNPDPRILHELQQDYMLNIDSVLQLVERSWPGYVTNSEISSVLGL